VPGKQKANSKATDIHATIPIPVVLS
jgi:hypothetical protein